MKNPYHCPYQNSCGNTGSTFLTYTDVNQSRRVFGVCAMHLHRYKEAEANGHLHGISGFEEITLEEAIVIDVLKS